MSALLFFGFIAIVLVMLFMANNAPNNKKPEKFELEIKFLNEPDDNFAGQFVTRLAGVNLYDNKPGFITGIAFNQKDNQHNPKAISLVNSKGLPIGYVPDADLPGYWAWCQGEPRNFAAFIRTFQKGGKTMLYGQVVFIKPCSLEFVQKVSDEYEKRYQSGDYNWC